MKTTRYRFEQAVQEVKADTISWLKDELRAILESDKDFTRKADYIGFSIASIDAKVASIDEEIKELQQLKKNLKQAKEITLTTGAEVFAEYGVEKLEGAGISSITITKPTSKSKQQLHINDEAKLIKLGYTKVVLDEDKVLQALESQDEVAKLYATLDTQTIITKAKLRINKRRDTTQHIEEILS
jgi:hypothetical protein